MAFIDNTNYCGLQASEIYTDCIFGAPTLAKNGAKFLNAVKKSIKIPIMLHTSVLQADSCAQTPQGSATLSEKEVSVCKFKMNVEYCIQDIETSYLSEQMRAGAMNSDFPTSALDFTKDLVVRQTRKEYEEILQQGDTTYVGPNTYLALCDGFLKVIAADPNTIPVANIVLTAANIVAELTKVYNAIDDCIMDDPELKLYMPINTKKMLRQAMASTPSQVNNLGIGLVGNDDFDFFGIPIIFTHGIPSDTIVATVVQNLQVATDLVTDIDNVSVFNKQLTTGDDAIAFKGRFFSGVNIYDGKYCVLYS